MYVVIIQQEQWRELLEEERVRSAAAMQRSTERAQEEVQAKMEDIAKVM